MNYLKVFIKNTCGFLVFSYSTMKNLLDTPWRFTVFLSVIIGLLIGYWTIIPYVTVESGINLDPKDAMSTRFIAQNQSIFAIKNYRYDCMISTLGLPYPYIGISSDHYSDLQHLSKTSLFCNIFSNPLLPQLNGKFMNKTLIIILVSYHYLFWPSEITSFTVFNLKRDESGSVNWLPIYSGMGKSSALGFIIDNPPS